MTRRWSYFSVWCIIPMMMMGCTFGPRAIEQTHAKYGVAIQRVDEEQLLRNIVRLRYLEAPGNLDIAAVAAQYELSLGAEARPFFSTESGGNLFRPFSAILPFAAVEAANRPTVSLDPQDEASSVRQYLTPISTETLIFLCQSGWPVATVLRIWTERINGIPNSIGGIGLLRNTTQDIARFQRATELMQLAQDQELMSVKAIDRETHLSDPIPAEKMDAQAAAQAAKDGYEWRKHGGGWVIVKKERRLLLEVQSQAHQRAEILELIRLLHLQPGEDRYELVVATGVVDPIRTPGAQPSKDLRVTPRSSAQAMFFLSNGVDVPRSHIECDLVKMPSEGISPLELTHGIMQIRSCAGYPRKPPKNAYCAIYYRDHWFYIDDHDHASKATLLLMLQLRRLDFQRQRIGNVPALTLPVGR